MGYARGECGMRVDMLSHASYRVWSVPAILLYVGYSAILHRTVSYCVACTGCIETGCVHRGEQALLHRQDAIQANEAYAQVYQTSCFFIVGLLCVPNTYAVYGLAFIALVLSFF